MNEALTPEMVRRFSNDLECSIIVLAVVTGGCGDAIGPVRVSLKVHQAASSS